jgi:fatty-acyl-CoA synthase
MRLGSIEEFISQTRLRVRGADSRLLIADDDLAAFLEPDPDDPPIALLSGLANGDAGAFVEVDVDPESLAILQFTSGSTSDPKGVMLPHRVVLTNLDGVATAAEYDPHTDVLVSWLPLYHDMGLIGLLLLSMSGGADLVLGAPQDFMAAPARWMQWMSDFGGTATAGPNFSYALAARALRRMEGLDLSRWRVALNGAEPVDPETVTQFCEAAARHGFNAGAAFPAFGMAELAIGGSFPPPGRGVVIDTVDQRVLETDRYAAPVAAGAPGSRGLARLGRPIPGLQMRIADPISGDVMSEREVGELQITGTSVTTGYYKHPAATAAAFTGDGWFRTGDLGELDQDGYLRINGRTKELIITGGFNVYPREVEELLRSHAAVSDAAVVGAPSAQWGETVVAFVVPARDSAGLVAELEEFVASHLVGYKRPREWRVVDRIPRNALGKILRHELVV